MKLSEFINKPTRAKIIHALHKLELEDERIGKSRRHSVRDVTDKCEDAPTYAGAVHTVNDLEEMGLIESERVSRKKSLKLTDTGKRLAKGLQNVSASLSHVELEA